MTLLFSRTPDGWRLVNLVYGGAVALDKALDAELATIENRLKTRAAAFVDVVANGRLAEAKIPFSEVMRKGGAAAKITEGWQTLGQVGGKFLGQDPPRIERVAEFFAVFVPCRWERNRLNVKVVFDLAGNISGVWTEAPSGKQGETPPAPGRSGKTAHRRRDLF